MKNNTPYEKILFPNGARLILVPMDGVNSVASAVMVGVGSRYEEAPEHGISHFLEHMVFKGTKKYPTTDDVNVIERYGGLQNAYTDLDITNYHNKVLAEDWKLGLEINKELSLNPLLEDKHVERERNVIIEEMKRYEDEPSAKVNEVFHEIMYPRTKLGRRIIGTADSLHGQASKELSMYHKKWYAPERLAILLAGDIKNEISNIKNSCQEWFGNLPASKTGDIEVVKDSQTEPRLEVVTKPDAQQAHMTIGLRTFNRSSEERFAWNIFNILFGVSFSSRLFKEVREKRGLCYHIRSSSDAWADVGYWSIYAGVGTDKVEEATRAIMHELSKAVQGGVTEDEVMVSKKRLKTLMAFKGEDPEFMTEFYGRQELFGEPMLTIDEYLKKIESVTVDGINSLIRKYFVTKNLNMALVWNKKRDEKMLDLLKV
jgi:predicted Zn-dependent peptidase